MGSLTAHLLEAGDHGRLRFHPSCPVCRQERLYGTLSSEPVVSRRAQALLAGGVLAVSSAAPAIAVAQEPDRQFEGVAAPEESGAPDLDDPTFDPGGDTALSFDTAPVTTAPGDAPDSGSGAPLDVEPTVDLDAQLTPLAETGAPGTEEQAAVPPVETVTPGAVPPSDAVPDGTVSPGATAQPVGPETPGLYPNPAAGAVPPAQPSTEAGEWSTHGPRTHKPIRAHGAHNYVPSDAGAPALPQRVGDGAGAPSEPDVPAVSPAPVPVAVAQTDASSRMAPQKPSLDGDARFHVVQPGDSLWSIAKQLLGRDASAGRIAREVNRLWSLNRSRIATGDPDLLMVGTRLELR